MASYEQGYEDERFENSIGQNFHCPICMNVFKDPLMCQRNQHCFCRPCITKHLQNSQTCPSCMEDLTLDTVRQAPRIFLGCLSELNIRCDYFSRGCRELVPLEKLESHVKDCGFAPVVCSNEGCLVEINIRDRAHHEAEVCELRKVKCHNCSEMTKMLKNMKIDLMATKDKLDVVENGLTAIKNEFHEAKGLKQQVDQSPMSDEIREIKGKQAEIMKEIRRIQHGATKEKPTIVVAGGFNDEDEELDSVEMFDWSTRSWSQLQSMEKCHEGASSFVYENQLTVAGGWTDRFSTTDSMEQLNIGPVLDHSTRWHQFPAKLPGKLTGHKTVVYNDRLIVIGGHHEFGYISDAIHEVLLRPPYTTKLLVTMPQPSALHGVEILNDKIFFLGGCKTYDCINSVDSVLMYDINKNKCQQMTSLPISVHDMATIKWSDNIILLGGKDKDGNTLNTVIIYDVKTGKSHKLPEMKYKRKACAAVVSRNTIVVMGGYDGSGNYHKSVECFAFDHYSWEDLPSMNERRARLTAVSL